MANVINISIEHEGEANHVLEDFRGRLGKLGLELNTEKTGRVEFWRFAEQRRERREEGKPETFDLLRPHSDQLRDQLVTRGGPAPSCLCGVV